MNKTVKLAATVVVVAFAAVGLSAGSASATMPHGMGFSLTMPRG